MGRLDDRFLPPLMVPGMAHCRGGVGTDTFDAARSSGEVGRNGQALPADWPPAR